jgi:hypothetical protein
MQMVLGTFSSIQNRVPCCAKGEDCSGVCMSRFGEETETTMGDSQELLVVGVRRGLFMKLSHGTIQRILQTRTASAA